MKISQLYIYPVKSLRPTSLTEAAITKHGLNYDRRFMLLKVKDEDTGDLENMHVADYPELTLFLTDLVLPGEGDDGGSIRVTYQPAGSDSSQNRKTLEIPLDPDVQGLRELDIVMHKSPTKGYDMGHEFNNWFSECLGYKVILAHLGQNRRPVLGSLSPNAAAQKQQDANGGGGWLSMMKNSVSLLSGSGGDDSQITFADCAPFLVVSETSLHNVSARLPEGEEMDITKFRPNIVVSGSEEEFEEDFWGELTAGDEKAKLHLTANCTRCMSINVDFATGKYGTGESGKVLKKLMKDRRVDKGVKYRPVFGRYGFPDKASDGMTLRVGDEVDVSKRLIERTTFDWPGLSE
ncbi:MOSC domain containing protein [Paecilomyces variotii No. 5]|uniref:MOSC domain containing protein n=1 Tax=Byssochlamys spectabilis (strain No. 5 / NBRC 109023) TaxID=1356009 RepID=V5GA84_BYSSN|nr:MOSC domain containing protein [Paecilomyces variotii No. 5]